MSHVRGQSSGSPLWVICGSRTFGITGRILDNAEGVESQSPGFAQRTLGARCLSESTLKVLNSNGAALNPSPFSLLNAFSVQILLYDFPGVATLLALARVVCPQALEFNRFAVGLGSLLSAAAQ